MKWSPYDHDAWTPHEPEAKPEQPLEYITEIHAAEILDRRLTREPFWDWNRDELHGWRDAYELDGNECPCSDSSRCRHIIHNWDAGYLARIIHDTPEAP